MLAKGKKRATEEQLRGLDKLAGIALFVDQFGVQSPGRAISHAAIITHEAASVAYAEYHICATAFVVVLKRLFRLRRGPTGGVTGAGDGQAGLEPGAPTHTIA
jgi:hypothetical protein